MNRQMLRVVLLLFLGGAAVAGAQQNVTSSGGTPQSLAKFTGQFNVQNSLITDNGVGVGINAQNGQSPQANLDIFSNLGDIQLSYNNPAFGIEINETAVSGWSRETSFASNGQKLGSFGANGTTYATSASLNYLYINANQAGAPAGCGSNCSSPNPTMVFLPSGNVGIGTTTPSYALDVSGKIRSSTGGVVYPDGTTQTTAWTGVVCGGDYAESVDVTGDRRDFAPGDVLVIDPDSPGKFLKSGEPYSSTVTGIYSTKPGTVGRRQKTPYSPDEVPMAMMGIVPVKATAENGIIRPGDLLVTSSKIGYAMKGTDRSRMLGAVIGKALGSLDSGTGVLEVVVTLQ